MSPDVLCLRPEADFQRVGALPPASLKVVYRAPNDADVPQLMKQARALVIPAVGPKLPTELFAGARIQFIQVTGAGLDRLDLPFLKQRGIAVANVPEAATKRLRSMQSRQRVCSCGDFAGRIRKFAAATTAIFAPA